MTLSARALITAGQIIRSSCPAQAALTAPQRLAVMQQAVYLVSTALGNFYAKLSDEQKAKFEAIGQSARRSFVTARCLYVLAEDLPAHALEAQAVRP